MKIKQITYLIGMALFATHGQAATATPEKISAKLTLAVM